MKDLLRKCWEAARADHQIIDSEVCLEFGSGWKFPDFESWYESEGAKLALDELGKISLAFAEKVYPELQEEAKGAGWIPCSERLPELNKDVLWFDNTDEMSVGHLTEGRWRQSLSVYISDDCWPSVDFFTHWLPLPEAPK